MTLKHLRDYINMLDLDEVESFVEIIVHVSDNQNGALDFDFFDVVSDFHLVISDEGKAYLSISGKSFTDYLDSLGVE